MTDGSKGEEQPKPLLRRRMVPCVKYKSLGIQPEYLAAKKKSQGKVNKEKEGMVKEERYIS